MDWQKAQSLAVEVARGAVFADEFEKGGKYALHATGRVGVVLAKAAATGGLLAVIREAPNTLKKRLDDIVALLGRLKSRLKNPSAELLARLETDLANKEFFDALLAKNELVDAWERLDGLGVDIVPDALRRNPKLIEALGFVAWLPPNERKSTGMANFEIAKPTKLPPDGPVLCQKYTFLLKRTTNHAKRTKNRQPLRQSTALPIGRSTIKP